MSRCTEPLLWFCSSCSHPFEMGEWEGHDRSCPVCHSSSGVWRCGKCSVEFGQPSLGSDHPCLAKPKPPYGTKLVSRSIGRRPPILRLTPELPKDSRLQIKTEIFDPFLKEQNNPPVLAQEIKQPRGIWRFFSTKGRASRREYCLVTFSTPFLLSAFLVIVIIIAVLFVLLGFEQSLVVKAADICFILFGCPLVFWIYLAVFVRRRHDVGLPGRKRLNAFHTIFLLFKKGDLGPNVYGPPPN